MPVFTFIGSLWRCQNFTICRGFMEIPGLRQLEAVGGLVMDCELTNDDHRSLTTLIEGFAQCDVSPGQLSLADGLDVYVELGLHILLCWTWM